MSDAAQVTISLITALATIATGYLAYLSQKHAKAAIVEVKKVETAVDGKMSELLAASKKADNLEGAERERVEARARDREADRPMPVTVANPDPLPVTITEK